MCVFRNNKFLLLINICIIQIYIYVFIQKSFLITTWYQLIGLMNSKDNMFLLLFITATYACVNYNNSVLFYPAATFSFLFFAKTAHIFNKNVFFSINENTTNLNTNLINGTMLIHPVILYTYYAVLLVVVCFFLKTFFKKRCKNFTKKLKNNFLFKLVIISILLGCYWAEQELLWGG